MGPVIGEGGAYPGIALPTLHEQGGSSSEM